MTKQAEENLVAFVDKFKSKFEERLQAYNAVGKLDWNAPSWHFGEKGVAWLKEAKDSSFKFDQISNRTKGLSGMDVSPEFQDFMRAYQMLMVSSSDALISGSTLDKPLQVMKRWYWEMVTVTGQTHPKYLTAEIIHNAMDRHKDNTKSAPNLSDYCDVAVSIIKRLRQYNLFVVNVEVKNKYPCRNQSNGTKERRKAEQGNPDSTDDEKLISIRAFMCVVELITLAENDYQRLFYNMLLLAIICGFRFQEMMTLRMDALVKIDIKDKDKRQHAIDNGWPTYRLGIRYLGAKQSGWRTHWLAPTSFPVVESIFRIVEELTAYSRAELIKFRNSGFTDFLPNKIAELPDENVECRELYGIMFEGSGGARNVLNKSICNSIKKFSGHEPTIIPVHNNLKNKFFTKEQLNDYVFQRYAKSKNFDEGHQCVLSVKNGGDWEHFKYEDLMFILPEGAFGIVQDFVSLQSIVPLEEHSVEAWLGGAKNRKSIFDYFDLLEDDGSRISIKKHVPRHNINTFLAIAGVTDHIQAILMGRVDITQNKHYQHQAESQSYQAASLAVTSLEKALDENKKVLSSDDQLSLFDADGEPTPPSTTNLVSLRMAALAKSVNASKNTGVSNVKATASMLVDPKLSMEHNMKQNMQTFGETTEEVTRYIESTMGESFLPELKSAHEKLLKQEQKIEAKQLIERHAKLHPLGFGGCTRDVASWGCPYAMKCQSGLPCGYFTLTGRLGEAEEISRRLQEQKIHVRELRMLNERNPGFKLALQEHEDALIVLENLANKSLESLKPKRLVSLLSEDEMNPLGRIIARINEQKLIGKSPRTLADLFFIEQKRLERDDAKKDENND